MFAFFRLLVFFICFSFLFSSCRLPVCKEEPMEIRGNLKASWNVIRHHSVPTHINHWVNQFLERLLRSGSYKMEAQGKKYVVVDPQLGHQERCRVRIQKDIALLGDPHFESRLYRIVKKYKIDVASHLYQPPLRFVTVEGSKGKTTIIHCQSKKFLSQKLYWETISDKSSKESWPEACKINTTLLQFKTCFSKRFEKLFQRRTKRNCSSLQ